jgi:xylan 1,4-beta-xylosidase
MRGNPDSCGIHHPNADCVCSVFNSRTGVWAPCLTHDGSKFWLVYTDVKRKDGSFKDTPNYIVTANHIEGPWSGKTPMYELHVRHTLTSYTNI